MSRDSGEECLRGTLPDSCPGVSTEVTETGKQQQPETIRKLRGGALKGLEKGGEDGGNCHIWYVCNNVAW